MDYRLNQKVSHSNVTWQQCTAVPAISTALRNVSSVRPLLIGNLPVGNGGVEGNKISVYKVNRTIPRGFYRVIGSTGRARFRKPASGFGGFWSKLALSEGNRCIPFETSLNQHRTQQKQAFRRGCSCTRTVQPSTRHADAHTRDVQRRSLAQ